MADKELVVLLGGERIGLLTEDLTGRHWFTYDADGPDRTLSVSMPRRSEPWGPDRTEPFLDGLLPDSDAARGEIARRHDVSAGNAFALLSAIGKDCAGAVQFVLPGDSDPNERDELTPVGDRDIGDRLRALVASRSPSWQARGEHWSLAGAQLKIALHRHGGRWFQATGSVPTTHILKPGVSELHCQAYNEVLCLAATGELGLPVADTSYGDFDGVRAVVSRRWDRVVDDSGAVHRVHQEDLCQALAVPSRLKYQSEGGPSPSRIIALLRSLGLHDDVWLFVRALGVNFLLGATDAHAKNYALLHPTDGPPHLAPLYDMASVYPYDPDRRSRKLAMKVGSRYGYDEIEMRNWIALAEEDTLEPQVLLAQLYLDAIELPSALEAAIELHRPQTVEETRLARTLTTAVEIQCSRVEQWFGAQDA